MKHTAENLRCTISALLADEQAGICPDHLNRLLERLASSANAHQDLLNKNAEMEKLLQEVAAWFALDDYRSKPVFAKDAEMGRAMLVSLQKYLPPELQPDTPSWAPQAQETTN